MTQIESDLICEIIRKSQTHFLEKKDWGSPTLSEACEKSLVAWVKNNAQKYREHYKKELSKYSSTELGDILKVLDEAGKDLNEILRKCPEFTECDKAAIQSQTDIE